MRRFAAGVRQRALAGAGADSIAADATHGAAGPMSEDPEVPASLCATAVGEEPDPFGATRHEASAPLPTQDPGGLLPCGAQVGRYVVLAQLGQGGMGVVYAAYDPELGRKVALKLIAGEAAALAEDRLQREARAMAQLAHPNVVTVHDVGTLGRRLWIAMEFVDGTTLSEWTRERRRHWREVLAMFLAAGEGLVAAHRAGIVHRDFKPDNVMVGADGRARVMDFGLARAGATPPDDPPHGRTAPEDLQRSAAGLDAVTRVGAVLGTPRYMAPEQWAGAPIDARTDEFAFCMALWEALYGQPPMAGQTLAAQALAVTTGQFMPVPSGVRVPGWVRKACRRGLAVEPSQRFASMAELLAALRRDPAPRRRRIAAAALALLIAGGVWAGGELRAAKREAVCAAAGTGIDPIWNAATRTQLRSVMIDSGMVDAESTFEHTAPWFDQFVARWSTTASETCRDATITETLAPERAWQIVGCLDEARAEAGELVATLMSGEAKVLRSAASNAAQLSDPRRCGDDARLADHGSSLWSERAEVAELRRGLARTGVLRRTGKLGLAAATVAAIELRAAALAAPSVLATAQLEAGMIAEWRGEYVAARAEMEAAYYGAGAIGADALAATAAEWLCFVIGWDLGETEVALGWGKLAEMTLGRLQVPALDQRRARLDGDLGVVLLRHGDVEAAMARLHASIAIYEQLLGPDHPEVVSVLNSLATAHHQRGEYEKSLAIFERLVAIEVKNLGPKHSSVALSRGNVATVQLSLGRVDEARAGFTWAAQILERSRGPDHPDVALAMTNLAAAELAAGDEAQSLVHTRRALAIREKAFGPDSDLVAASLDDLGESQRAPDQLAAGLAAHRRALAIYERNHGPNHTALTASLRGIGDILVLQGAPDEARVYYQRALVIDEAEGSPSAARTLWGLGEVALARREYSEARALFARAVTIDEDHYGSEHPNLSPALLGRGEAELALGDAATAAALFERVLRLHELSSYSPAEAASARFALARALWAGAEDRPRALREARQARDELRATPSAGRELAKVEAWLADKGR